MPPIRFSPSNLSRRNSVKSDPSFNFWSGSFEKLSIVYSISFSLVLIDLFSNITNFLNPLALSISFFAFCLPIVLLSEADLGNGLERKPLGYVWSKVKRLLSGSRSDNSRTPHGFVSNDALGWMDTLWSNSARGLLR